VKPSCHSAITRRISCRGPSMGIPAKLRAAAERVRTPDAPAYRVRSRRSMRVLCEVGARAPLGRFLEVEAVREVLVRLSSADQHAAHAAVGLQLLHGALQPRKEGGRHGNRVEEERPDAAHFVDADGDEVRGRSPAQSPAPPGIAALRRARSGGTPRRGVDGSDT